MGFEDRIMEDGAVVESSIPMNMTKAPESRFENFKVYKAQIDVVIYADDKRNITGNVEYDLSIFSSNVNEIYRRVKNAVSLNTFGGINDWSEVVYKEVSKVIRDGAGGSEAYPENKNGDIVAVTFLEGNEKRAVILGPWSHKLNTNSANKSDGHRLKGEYNGIEWEINKNGEFEITSLGGPRDDNGNLTNESNGGLKIKFSKTGNVTIESGSQPIITVDKSGNEITIEANNVKIGDGAIEPIVLGNTWVIYNNAEIITKLNALISAVGTLITEFNAHTHSFTDSGGDTGTTGTADQGSSGASPPSTAASAGSSQLAVKGKCE